jgi:FtsZ-binding cell division protein ZapB
MKTKLERAIEICQNLQSTISKLGSKNQDRVQGFSNLQENNPWSDLKPSKSQLKTLLNNVMTKHNITKEQLKQ